MSFPLNTPQKEAVQYIEGPLLVLAGAGSGKTRVITQKIAYLIQSGGVAARHIAAVTFTNKAAQEMRSRVANMLPMPVRRGLKISTFHTLGLRMVQKHPHACGLRPGFSIMDSDDALDIMRQFLVASKASDKAYLQNLQQQISRWKNQAYHPDAVVLESSDIFLEEALIVYKRYQSALQAYNAVDFDDLIRLPVQLLQQQEDIRCIWQDKIRYLLVDEYQDSNTLQYAFVKALVGEKANFTVVGDDYQSIYSWRGACPQHLMQLQDDFKKLHIIKLEQNYRSMGYILQAANSLIKHNTLNFHKALWSDLGYGDRLRVMATLDEAAEAEQIAMDMFSHKMQKRAAYGDYAILYRNNHQARPIEKALRDYGIPYRVTGGPSWFARAEVKDVLAYIKLLANPEDDPAFLRTIRTPKRGVGEQSLEALGRYAEMRGQSLYVCAGHVALSQYVGDKACMILQCFQEWIASFRTRLEADESVVSVLKSMVYESGYEAYIHEQSSSSQQAQKRIECIWELIDWIGRLLQAKEGSTLGDVLTKLMLIERLENSEATDNTSVHLMTLHAAKGLEFPYVYLAGMEEGILPHHANIEDNDRLEEERRLLYVGITRAQKELCFSLARQRKRAGELQDTESSRFLLELPQDIMEWLGNTGGEADVARADNTARQHLSLLKESLGG
ncbi:MAG: 3'-5' exonuclease [Legionellaceae bacterium]|nr:3'-5' exonuclease [Legionellaceae bacterium]